MPGPREQSRKHERRADIPDNEIPGPHKDSARLMRKIVGPKASVRQIELKSGVNQKTLDTMLKGGRGESESIIRFARAYGVNPNLLLVLQERDRVPEFDMRDWPNTPGSAYEATPRSAASLVRESKTASESQLLIEFLAQVYVVQPDGSKRLVNPGELTPDEIAGLRAWMNGELQPGQLPTGEPSEEAETQ